MINNNILEILLKDMTLNKNIKWATNDYLFKFDDEISFEDLKMIKHRFLKTDDKKRSRTKKKGEVFTPTWICKEQNDVIDKAWWKDKSRTWKDYVKSNRLEIACGEAPYLTSRYDTVTGEKIAIADRIGMLDRKLQLINKNVYDKKKWLEWVIKAYKSIYGYEYQGDSLFLARKNVFLTFVENFEYKFSKLPSFIKQRQIAEIIAWNIWQMDGIKLTIPNTEIFSKIYDWDAECIIEYKSLMK